MNKLTGLALAGMIVIGFAAPVLADDMFQNLDTNKDGFISMAEAMAVYPTLDKTLFDQADANKDGKLDASEYISLQGLTAGTDTAGKSSSSSSAN